MDAMGISMIIFLGFMGLVFVAPMIYATIEMVFEKKLALKRLEKEKK